MAANRPEVVLRVVAAVLVVLAVATVCAVAASGASAQAFGAPVLVKTGPGTVTLVGEDVNVRAGDVNGDGNPDLVAATSGAVVVLYGNGDGSFRRRAYRVRDSIDVAVGDVSGDGRPDLIAVGTREDELDSFVVVLINLGAERFRRAGVHTISGEVSTVAAGDLNGDGVGDVVVDGLSGDFVVLLAVGDGRLAAPLIVPGRGGCHLTIGDFNGDRRLDAALAALSDRSIRVRLGVGDGTFGPASAFGVADSDAMRVSAADLNNDSALDLVVTRDPEFVAVLLGDNDGTFGAQTTYRMGDPGYSTGAALVGDFDGDDVADIATGSYGHPIPVRLGAGNGTFGQRRALPPFSHFTSAVEEYPGAGAVADFNNDGRLDLAVVARTRPPDGTEPYEWPGPGWLAVLLNRTGLDAPSCVVVPVTHEPLRVAKRHLNNAGCRVDRVVRRFSRKARQHRVIAQRPGYGSVLGSRAAVRLVVSRGRQR